MEISKCVYQIRCESDGCNEYAQYTLKAKRAGIRGAMHFCRSCAQEFYEALAAEFVPKSLKPPFLKKEEGVISIKEVQKLQNENAQVDNAQKKSFKVKKK